MILTKPDIWSPRQGLFIIHQTNPSIVITPPTPPRMAIISDHEGSDTNVSDTNVSDTSAPRYHQDTRTTRTPTPCHHVYETLPISGDTTPFWGLPEVDLKRFSHKHRPIFAGSSTSSLQKPFPLPLRVHLFVLLRVSSFPVPHSHVLTRAFIFSRRASPGQLHLPSSDARVPRLLHQQTDLPSVAFPSPCSPPYYS